ncbi:hypothetical protein HO932_04420 [Streptococcus suis]|nr:hypothetical protein [Streptococcus suis]NQP16674.1 hypothetical protein [Streptococcus suis]
MDSNLEIKMKYLEMIQNVITRMASNSFMIKGWAITVIGAIFSFWITNKTEDYSSWLLYLIVGLTILFWLHDAYYLKLERDFRKLYDKIRKMELTDPKLLEFKLTPIKSGTLLNVAITRPVLYLPYGIIILVTILLLFCK